MSGIKKQIEKSAWEGEQALLPLREARQENN